MYCTQGGVVQQIPVVNTRCGVGDSEADGTEKWMVQ